MQHGDSFDNFDKTFDKNFNKMLKFQALLAGCGLLTLCAIAGGLIWAAIRIWG